MFPINQKIINNISENNLNNDDSNNNEYNDNNGNSNNINLETNLINNNNDNGNNDNNNGNDINLETNLINNNDNDDDVNNNDDRKEFANYIEKYLNISQQMQILKILKENNIKMTENSNGCFINFSLINETIYLKLKDFVNFIILNEKNLKENEERINNIKDQLNDVENKEENDELTTISDIKSTQSFNSSIFKEYEDIKKNNEYINIDENMSGEGYKINLKKNKKKFNGYKLKILKKYKEISTKN